MTKTIAVLIGIKFVRIGPVAAADRVRIGVPQQVIHWMTFPLAYKRGFFKEEGIDAEIVRFLGTAGRSSLASGEIDYYTTIAFMSQSIISGLPAKVMAAYVTCPGFVLMAAGGEIGAGSQGQNRRHRRPTRQCGGGHRALEP